MSERTCWIETLTYDELDARGQEAYANLRRADGTIHNLYKPYSLWPGPLTCADQLYKDILHAPDGPLTMAEREFLGTQVALLCDCIYAQTHHGENFKLFWGDREEAEKMLTCLRERRHHDGTLGRRLAALADYGAKLTLKPNAMREDDLVPLRAVGLSDAEIFHANQVSANFAYWVRTINGLGIILADEKVGLDHEKVSHLKMTTRQE